MTLSRWPAAGVAIIAGSASIAAVVSLAWVYWWAVKNNSAADSEHQRLVIAAMISCALLAAAVVFGLVVDADGRNATLAVIRAGAAGAFVAVSASSASTLLIAMAISPATDPGDFGRSIFRFAYVGALILSLCVGLAAAWPATTPDRRPAAAGAAAVLAVVLTTAAWAYLAVGSSELNQCVVHDEFPLATDHVCSGY